MVCDEVILEECRKLLRRSAWRLKYRIRNRRAREVLYSTVHHGVTPNFVPDVISQLYIEELLQVIPSERGKYIIRRLVIDGLTEKEVAAELNITQQAVNKCKHKGFEALRKVIDPCSV